MGSEPFLEGTEDLSGTSKLHYHAAISTTRLHGVSRTPMPSAKMLATPKLSAFVRLHRLPQNACSCIGVVGGVQNNFPGSCRRSV